LLSISSIAHLADKVTLDPSSKSGAFRHYRKDYTARTDSAAGFLICGVLIEKAVLFCRNLSAAFSANLTRRANHLHTDIIARSSTSPRRQRWRAFSLPRSDGGAPRERPHSLLTSPHARRCPSLQHINQYWPACANAPAGARRRAPAAPVFSGDRVRARNDRVQKAIMPRFFLSRGNSEMTAYLISLAIMFLVAIALFDGMS